MCQSSATDSKLLTLPPYLHKNPSNYSHKLDKPYSCLLLFHKLHARLSFSFRRADALAMLTRKGHLLHDTRDIIKHLTKQHPPPPPISANHFTTIICSYSTFWRRLPWFLNLNFHPISDIYPTRLGEWFRDKQKQILI